MEPTADPARYKAMPTKTVDPRARAERLFKTREQQKADAPVAMAEYRAAQQATWDRMHQLKQMRLARGATRAAAQPQKSAG
jgi:hypothetical protein